MPKVGSTVSTPAGDAKVNSLNVLKRSVTLWMIDQKQVVEMPVAELQMQYGVTVRPVELMREIEEPLKRETADAGAPTLGMAPEQVEEISAPGPVEASGPPTDGERRRRRGRRGGRGRRKPGGDGGPPPGPPASA